MESMSGLSYAWMLVYHAFKGNEFLMLTIGSVLILSVFFILSNIPFAILDLTGWPHSLLQYKIQDEKAIPVNWNTYWKTMKRTAFNVWITSSIFQILVYPLGALRTNCTLPLPSFSKVVWDLLICVVVVEILFYYTHRIFHHPKLYKLVHKTHHEWVAPVSIVSVYCHPLEHCAVNLLPVVAGPLVAGSHLSVAWLWFLIVIVLTSINHCGYHFPFFPSAESHDFHHAKFNQCYGVIGILDYLHGTDTLFRQSQCYPRHVILTGLASAKTLYPEQNKKKYCPSTLGGKRQ